MVINKALIENIVIELQSRKNHGYEDITDIYSDQELFVKSIFRTDDDEMMFANNLGSFEYGLPSEAVQYRGLELEKMRKKIKLMNLLLVSYGRNHPFIKLGLKDSEDNFNIFSNAFNNATEENIYEDSKEDMEIKDMRDFGTEESPQGNVNENVRYEEGQEMIGGEDLKDIHEFDQIQKRRSLIMEALEKRLSAQPSLEISTTKQEEDTKKNQ